MPTIGDRINFTYNVKKLNGAVVLSENEIGLQSYVVDQSNQELISGLREGVKLMKEGETITFLFPSHKAFGYTGNDKIETNQPLIYRVQLKEIKNKIK